MNSTNSNSTIEEAIEEAMLARGLGFLQGTPLWETAKMFMYKPSRPRYGEREELVKNWDGYATSLFSGLGWGANIDTTTRHHEWHIKVFDTAGRWCWSSRETEIPLGLDQTQWKIIRLLQRVKTAIDDRNWAGLLQCRLTQNQVCSLPDWMYHKALVEAEKAEYPNNEGLSYWDEFLGETPREFSEEDFSQVEALLSTHRHRLMF